MKPKELLVFVEEHYCGVLREDNHGKHSFTYDSNSPTLPRLSLSMPQRSAPWTGKPVEAYIDGILPDDRDMRRRIARLYDVNANNPFSLLTAIGLDCAGGAQFVLPEQADSFRKNAELRPISEREVEQKLRAIADSSHQSWQNGEEHWSLNGAQDKIALCLKEGQWHEALGSAATTHIIKPGINRLHEQAFNEYVCMKTLRGLNMPTATTDFHLFGTLPTIVSTRWDRKLLRLRSGEEEETVARIHQEDFCQATAHMTREKYQSDGGPSAVDILRCIRENELNQASVMLFLSALILNFLMAGSDAHAKNYAILEPVGERPMLAPLYDIASMFAYDTQRKQRKLAMSIGGEYNWERIELNHWHQLAQDTKPADFELIQLLLHRYATLLPDAFANAGSEALKLSARELRADEETQDKRRELVARIQDGIAEQCGRVLQWFA